MKIKYIHITKELRTVAIRLQELYIIILLFFVISTVFVLTIFLKMRTPDLRENNASTLHISNMVKIGILCFDLEIHALISILCCLIMFI